MSKDSDEAKLWNQVASSDTKIRVDALLQLSYNASHREEFAECLAFCETAREIYEPEGTPDCDIKLGHIYFGIGHSLRNLNRSAEAAVILSKSADIYCAAGADDASQLCNEEGDAWFEAKQFDKALSAYERGIQSANPFTSELFIARNYLDAGTALEKLKEWDKALKYLIEARARYKKLKDLRTMAFCDEEISLCYVRLGDPVTALVYAQKAFDYATTAEDEVHIMWSKARLALSHKELGQLDVALKFFTEAKSSMVGKANPPWSAVIAIENYLAEIYGSQGENEKRVESMRRIESLKDSFVSEKDDLEEMI